MATRLAALDIGTNSVLLTVVETSADGPPRLLVDDAQVTRLGEGLAASGRLKPEAIARTVGAVREAVSKAAGLGAERMAAVATSAVREAANGHEFGEALRSALPGLDYRVIPGEEEAELSYRSVSLDPAFQHERRMSVIDIGGGSVEVMNGEGDHRLSGASVKLGAVKLAETTLLSDPPTAAERFQAAMEADELLKGIPQPEPGGIAVAVGATAVNLFSIRHRIARFDPHRIHGGKLSYEEVSQILDFLCSLPLEQRRKVTGLEPPRAETMPAGALILERVMQRLGVEEVWVSTYGLRFALLWEMIG